MNIDFEKLKEIFTGGYRLSTREGKIKRKNLAYIPRKDDLKTQRALAELDLNRNHSWYEEIYERNKNHLDKIALVYRDNEITYREMFSKMQEMAKSLKAYGIKKGDEVPVCMSNTPELVYLLGAISMIGAKINIFGPKYDPEYVTKILNGTNSSIAFIEDNHYAQLKNSIDQSNIQKVVMSSLADSLKNGIHPLEEEKYKERFESKVDKYRSDSILSIADFRALGKNYQGTIKEDVNLNDQFCITYTSGSTNAKHPKQIIHNVRSFIMIARHHDKDMSGGVDMSKLTLLSHIPPYSNTDIISSISDSLMQGSKLALEPIYDRNFFLTSLRINEPNCVIATTSFWIQAMKDAMYKPENKDLLMPYLLIIFAAGEGMSVNEEKFLNKALRKVRAGSKFLPPFLKSTVMSAGGGDCEHGSIFYSIFRRLFERKNSDGNIEEAGLKVMNFAELAVLDPTGHYCEKGEYGRIVANSGCSMDGYKDDPEATEKFFIKDAYGKTWGDCSIYGYVDKKNKVHIKGRIPKEGEKLPAFLITDEVLKDQNNILSALTVHVTDGENEYFVVHYEKMPESLKESEQLMREALSRIQRALGADVASKVLFREHDFYESFVLTGSGKSDATYYQNEGISEKTISVDSLEKAVSYLKK